MLAASMEDQQGWGSLSLPPHAGNAMGSCRALGKHNGQSDTAFSKVILVLQSCQAAIPPTAFLVLSGGISKCGHTQRDPDSLWKVTHGAGRSEHPNTVRHALQREGKGTAPCSAMHTAAQGSTHSATTASPGFGCTWMAKLLNALSNPSEPIAKHPLVPSSKLACISQPPARCSALLTPSPCPAAPPCAQLRGTPGVQPHLSLQLPCSQRAQPGL